MKNLYKIENELYIISNNESINENDHIITQDGILVEVSYLLSKDVQGGHKVILTTNKLLIKDGVQAIDDEFIEWLVNNTGCEQFEIEREKEILGEVAGTTYIDFKYKIIIPSAKQECVKCGDCNKHYLCTNCGEQCGAEGHYVEKIKEEVIGYICPVTKVQCDDECCYSSEDCHIEAGFGVISNTDPIEIKQETLEEILPKNINGKYSRNEIEKALKLGAKWQAERMYSEEDLKQAFKKNYTPFSATNVGDFDKDFNKWFETIKKK